MKRLRIYALRIIHVRKKNKFVARFVRVRNENK